MKKFDCAFIPWDEITDLVKTFEENTPSITEAIIISLEDTLVLSFKFVAALCDLEPFCTRYDKEGSFECVQEINNLGYVQFSEDMTLAVFNTLGCLPFQAKEMSETEHGILFLAETCVVVE